VVAAASIVLGQGRSVDRLSLLDGALTGLGLLPDAKAGRPAAPRIAGAFRLLRFQIIALIAQFSLIVAGAAAAAVGAAR
jgi:hypothetical protein